MKSARNPTREQKNKQAQKTERRKKRQERSRAIAGLPRDGLKSKEVVISPTITRKLSTAVKSLSLPETPASRQIQALDAMKLRQAMTALKRRGHGTSGEKKRK